MNAKDFQQQLAELERAFDEADGRADVSTIVLRGAGKAFVAGADVKFFVKSLDGDSLHKESRTFPEGADRGVVTWVEFEDGEAVEVISAGEPTYRAGPVDDLQPTQLRDDDFLILSISDSTIGHVKELEQQRRVVDEMAEAVFTDTGMRVEYMVGTMIELPRAALTAHEIAQVALRIRRRREQESEDERFIPGRAATIVVGGTPVGVFGELHPQVLESCR